MRALALCLPALVLAAAEPTAWTPEQMLKVRRIDAVLPAPDGKRALVALRDPVMTPYLSEFRRRIYVTAPGKAPWRLGPEDASVMSPAWSPDGQRVAYLAPKDGRSQLHVVNPDAGEAVCLTNWKGGVSDFAWSPDGTRFALRLQDPRTEAEMLAARGRDDARWHGEDERFTRLYVLQADGKVEPRCVTPFPREVATFTWSSDGQTLACTHQATASANDWQGTCLTRVDADSGRRVAEDVPLRTMAGTLAYAPDGQTLALVVGVEGEPTWASHDRLALLPALGSQLRMLPETLDGRPELVGWTPDGTALLYHEQVGTTGSLFTLEPATGRRTRLPLKGHVAAPRLNGPHLGFVLQDSRNPPEPYLYTLGAPEPRLADRFQGALPERPLPRTEVIRWKGADGLEIEGLLTYPTAYRPGSRVPLILNVHGGPAGAFAETFVAAAGDYPLAAFAAEGIAVLRPNPRGSTAYGWSFRAANRADWGGKDFEDVMKGVDHVIAMGVADPARLGVMGWSYGGYLTSWVIGHTDRFKAASIGAAVTNLVSFTGTADIPDFIPSYFGGEFWERAELVRERSPITHVGKMKTPALVQHCEGDLRVPIGQGYEIHSALKRRGVETRMLVVPRQAHHATEPKALLSVMTSNLEWFRKHLLTVPAPR